MKRIYYFLGLCLAIAFTSCDTHDETSGRENGYQDTLNVPSQTLEQYTESFQNLVKTDAGVFRGVNIGTSLENVKKMEDSAAVEEENGHIDFMVILGEFENADVRYLLDDALKVSGMEVNIYPKSKGSQDSIFMEMESYYTQKYGNALNDDPNARKWENKESNVYILMEKKDTQKVHDIKINIASLTRQTAPEDENPAQ